MITTYALTGLAIIVAVFTFTRYRNYALLTLIPLGFALWFAYVTKLPEQLGYPVAINFVNSEQGAFLYGVEGKEFIYILVIVKGEQKPRLIEMVNNPDNQKQLEKLNKTKAEGQMAVVRLKPGDKMQKKAGEISNGGDIDIVPLEKQQILTK